MCCCATSLKGNAQFAARDKKGPKANAAEIRDKPCRFFLRGNCTKGRDCPFRHDKNDRKDGGGKDGGGKGGKDGAGKGAGKGPPGAGSARSVAQR